MFEGNRWILSALIFIPLLSGAFSLIKSHRLRPVQWLMLWITLFVSTGLYLYGHRQYDPTQIWNYAVNVTFIPRWGIRYALGVDGFSWPFMGLSLIVTWVVALLYWPKRTTLGNGYAGCFLILQGLLCGVFAARDAFLFYLFFEASLIPVFFFIGFWGGSERIQAAVKFFLYTFAGSMVLLLCLIDLQSRYVQLGGNVEARFLMENWRCMSILGLEQSLLFFGLLFAFAVKIPMWPVHTWLPDAHVEAPTGGSVLLAAVLLKLGAYGMVRLLLPVVPAACGWYASGVIALSLVAIIYVGLVALVQKDLKKLIAYSSIMHMGFVTLGLFLPCLYLKRPGQLEGALMGLQGAFAQMISHGFVSAGLFAAVGMLYERHHTRSLDRYGGVATLMPRWAVVWVVLALANSGMPGTSGFVGEFLVLLSATPLSLGLGLLAGSSLFLSAGFNLWMVRRVLYGPVVHEDLRQLPDVNRHESIVLWGLIGLIGVMGLYPELVLKQVAPTSRRFLTHLEAFYAKQ